MSKKTETETDVVETGGTAIAPVYNYGEMAGLDSEAQHKSEIKVPFLKVTQTGTPEVLDADMPEVKAGMFYNSATGEVFSGEEGVHLALVYRDHQYVEWKPEGTGGKVRSYYENVPEDMKTIQMCRDKQDFGKWRNPHQIAEVASDAASKDKTPNFGNCNTIVETVYVWALLVRKDGSTTPVVMSITSKKMKPWNKWVQRVILQDLPETGGVKPPFFSHQIKVTSKLEPNEGFPDSYNIRISPLVGNPPNIVESCLKPDSLLLAQTFKMRNEIKAGGKWSIDDEREESDPDKPLAGGVNTDEEEVPF